jgi:transcriptional regulator with XRE-family HTH domain
MVRVITSGPGERLRRFIDDNRHTPEFEVEGLLLDLNAQISSAMQLHDVSRSELAERLGTSRAYVTKLLDGQENMTLKTLVRVANALEMKVDAKFVPRERVAKPAKHAEVKTVMRPKMRSGSPPANVAVKKSVAVAARTKR